MENVPDLRHRPGPHQLVTARAEAPTMPAVPPDTLWRSPTPIAVSGQRYTLGWQDARKEGHCFVIIRTSVVGEKVLDRFPLTEDGWVRAWAALVKLDAGAAQAVAKGVRNRQTALAARMTKIERQAQVYEAFVKEGKGRSTFRALGVQVTASDGKVYTTGFHNDSTKTNTSRFLGPLAAAQAMVTDGAQAWSPGRAMFMPIGLSALATKTKADAAVIFADGTVHATALDGNNAVREAQKQVVHFNALAGASAPEGTETGKDPGVKLRKLEELRDEGLLTLDEYETKRTGIIDSI